MLLSPPRPVLHESEPNSFSRNTASLTIQEFSSFIKIHKHFLFCPEEHWTWRDRVPQRWPQVKKNPLLKSQNIAQELNEVRLENRHTRHINILLCHKQNSIKSSQLFHIYINSMLQTRHLIRWVKLSGLDKLANWGTRRLTTCPRPHKERYQSQKSQHPNPWLPELRSTYFSFKLPFS